MGEHVKYRAGLVVGLIWSLALLYVAGRYVNLPVFTVLPTIMTAFFAPGVVLVLMIARVASRRLFAADMGHGDRDDIDQKVLTNTLEQLVAALCVWPAAAIILAGDGPGVIMVLGIGFAFARIVFWVGYHKSIALRAFGFGASFFPTVLVVAWVFWQLLTGYR